MGQRKRGSSDGGAQNLRGPHAACRPTSGECHSMGLGAELHARDAVARACYSYTINLHMRSGEDSIVVSTSRCGRENLGSIPSPRRKPVHKTHTRFSAKGLLGDSKSSGDHNRPFLFAFFFLLFFSSLYVFLADGFRDTAKMFWRPSCQVFTA